jgi:uncharacterized protein (TIGR03067 family)
MTGKDRPKEFATRAKSGHALETLRRAGTAVAPGAAKSTSAPEGEPAPELEGEWAMLSCVSGGLPLEEAYVKLGQRKAKGGKIKVIMAGQVVMQAKFAVDRSQRPMAINYVLKDGQSQHGIYELAGDILKVNFGSPGQPRPAEFVSTANDGRTLTVWRLVKR